MTDTKWTILRYMPPSDPDVTLLWRGFPPPDDMRLRWSQDTTTIFAELWYGSTNSYSDHTTLLDLLQQFNLPEDTSNDHH
jgi:hypothetical protein